MSYEIDLSVCSRAFDRMSRRELEEARENLKEYQKYGDRYALEKFLRLVEEADPGVARTIGARVRR